MNKIKLWLKATRAPFFTASLIPVMVGAALSSRHGDFSLTALFWGFFIVVSSHAGSNLINDYFDAEGSDRVNQEPTPFSGGSRLIQKQILTKKSFLKAAIFAYALSITTAGLLALSYRNGWILALALLGIILGLSYSASSTFGMGRGWGEIAIGFAFGPLAVLGSYILQTNIPVIEAFLVGIPVGFLIMGVVILNEVPDRKADQAVGKRTWVVRSQGGIRAVYIYLTVIALAYLTIFVGVYSGFFPPQILFSYVTIPLAVWVVLKAWRYREKVPELIPALAGNIGLHFFTGILLCLGLIWR